MCIEDLACSFWRRNCFEIELWETHDMINPTSGWGQWSSVHKPLCLEVCLIQSLALKSMICAASCSLSSRNEGMIWWSRLIIGFSWLSDYFYFSWGIVESLKISRVQDPLDQLSVMSVHIMYNIWAMGVASKKAGAAWERISFFPMPRNSRGKIMLGEIALKKLYQTKIRDQNVPKSYI
jgi:hypothetical protein